MHVTTNRCGHLYNKLCGRPPQYAPHPASWHFDLESGVRVTCDVDYLCSNFSLPRHLCSRLRPDARGGEIIVNVFFSRKFSPFWSLDPIHLWTDHIKIWRAKVPFVLLNFVVIGRISRPYGIKKTFFKSPLVTNCKTKIETARSPQTSDAITLPSAQPYDETFPLAAWIQNTFLCRHCPLSHLNVFWGHSRAAVNILYPTIARSQDFHVSSL